MKTTADVTVSGNNEFGFWAVMVWLPGERGFLVAKCSTEAEAFEVKARAEKMAWV